MATEIKNTDDIIDVRDVIARIEVLENERDAAAEARELSLLTELLSDMAGYGGDEQWRGDWYPITLIRDSHFQDYAAELAADIGAINEDAAWPNNCIDWERAARKLRQTIRPSSSRASPTGTARPVISLRLQCRDMRGE